MFLEITGLLNVQRSVQDRGFRFNRLIYFMKESNFKVDIYASVEKFPLRVILVLLLNLYDHEILSEKPTQCRACDSLYSEPTVDCPEQLSSNHWCLVFRSNAHINQSFQWSHYFFVCSNFPFSGVPL